MSVSMGNPAISEASTQLQQLRQELESARQELKMLEKKGFCKPLCRNYAYIVENAPVSVVITRADGLIEFINPKFEDITGYKLAEVVGKNPNILKSGETSEHEYQQMWETISQGKEWIGTFHNRRKNGGLFWERALISGIKDDSGTITHFIGIKEDITDVKEAEARLEQEQLKSIHNSKMAEIGILASGILHEVGNPIAAVRGLICDIKDSCKDFRDHESLNQMIDFQLDIILDEVDRITGITRDLAEFTYSNKIEPELLDLNEVIHTTCRLIKFDNRFKSIELKLNLVSQLPAIFGHKDQLSQVLFNLLSNAAHAVELVESRPSSVMVSTQFDKHGVHLQVKDNGCGIDEKKLPSLFDAFFTDKKVGEGSGLGLAISKSIIENHHGKIWLESKINVGTKVSIVLPINQNLY